MTVAVLQILKSPHVCACRAKQDPTYEAVILVWLALNPPNAESLLVCSHRASSIMQLTVYLCFAKQDPTKDIMVMEACTNSLAPANDPVLTGLDAPGQGSHFETLS